MTSANYTAKDITVLEGLDPVRKRPGMYIGGVGSTGLHHLVWEILDNAVDEAMNGFAANIWVTLHADGSSITIADDGRGIPIDKHSTTKKSALEVIFTVLHAGGKFKHGKPVGALKKIGASRGSGTTVYFHPDAAIFPNIEFDPEVIKARLEVASYLNKGLKVAFEDESSKEKFVFQHVEGLVDYLKTIVAERGAKPVHDTPFT